MNTKAPEPDVDRIPGSAGARFLPVDGNFLMFLFIETSIYLFIPVLSRGKSLDC
jgi:hypothetical protein